MFLLCCCWHPVSLLNVGLGPSARLRWVLRPAHHVLQVRRAANGLQAQKIWALSIANTLLVCLREPFVITELANAARDWIAVRRVNQQWYRHATSRQQQQQQLQLRQQQ